MAKIEEKFTELKQLIRDRIYDNEPLDKASWNDQYGIVLSVNEVSELIDRIETLQKRNDEAVKMLFESMKYMDRDKDISKIAKIYDAIKLFKHQ